MFPGRNRDLRPSLTTLCALHPSAAALLFSLIPLLSSSIAQSEVIQSSKYLIRLFLSFGGEISPSSSDFIGVVSSVLCFPISQ
ncbi:hypothetical protein BJX61DRAFT_493313 [Aspergillus egyptiacus]|nr:hypothetical protein BJX61DRAFT_493313 [Aspergillus egyptiacus]